MKYILVVESGSDIPKAIAKQYNIIIVPMHVSFNNKTLDDGSFDPSEIIDYYKHYGQLPKTSGCNPHDFIVFEKLHEKYPDAHILYLAYSSITTCSFQSAKIMAENKDYITLIDTKAVSIGQGSIVIEVAKYIEKHTNIELTDLLKYIDILINKSRMCFLPYHLDYLKAGGRVSNIAYIGATLLSIYPLIEIKEGKLVATKKYRGKYKKVIQKFIQDYTYNYNLKKDMIYFVYTIGFNDILKETITNIAQQLGFKDIIFIQAHGVITTHAGECAIGMAGFEE